MRPTYLSRTTMNSISIHIKPLLMTRSSSHLLMWRRMQTIMELSLTLWVSRLRPRLRYPMRARYSLHLLFPPQQRRANLRSALINSLPRSTCRRHQRKRRRREWSKSNKVRMTIRFLKEQTMKKHKMKRKRRDQKSKKTLKLRMTCTRLIWFKPFKPSNT